MERVRKGFTLIELLVVVAIIAILAAIAVPQYSKYKQRAYVAAMRSDAHNIIASEEAYFAQYDQYANGTAVAVDSTNGTITFKTPDGSSNATTIPLTENVVLLTYDGSAAGTTITGETCTDGSPGYKFALGHNNIKSGSTYKIYIQFDSCTDKAPEEKAQ